VDIFSLEQRDGTNDASPWRVDRNSARLCGRDGCGTGQMRTRPSFSLLGSLPQVVVMQTSKQRQRNNIALFGRLNQPQLRTILVQSSMRTVYLRVNDERPNINFELLGILSNTLSAYGLLEPDKETGEFHGLPREVCSPDEPAELEIRHTEQDADWDFGPWLSEKLNRMQAAAKNLVGVWLTDPSSVLLHKEAAVSARDWLRQMIALHFGELKQKARTVFEEVGSDKLEIKQVGKRPGPQTQ
jgi:hypothetical protein